ncbi:hypothetical protein CBR_g11073 [Chara braunii]|uniref:Peptide deformylase n=1 Tax=Chara braunii TaxID=69332 RepID=A0A388KPZ1_CHABU|nr:hypothetical protein CBR_g11073 [Chara braunii]|eukprot:GBG72140.1 hypothetical protein CBR_g11073 [Chara braunii]
MPTRDWTTKWQKIVTTPGFDLSFPNQRSEFFSRSCAGLRSALGNEYDYDTFQAILDRANLVIQTDDKAENERQSQPHYVAKQGYQRPTHNNAVISEETDDLHAAAASSSDGGIVAALPPKRPKRVRKNKATQETASTGTGQQPWTAYKISKDVYDLRQKYGYCLWCNDVTHVTAQYPEKGKARVPRELRSTPRTPATPSFYHSAVLKHGNQHGCNQGGGGMRAENLRESSSSSCWVHAAEWSARVGWPEKACNSSGLLSRGIARCGEVGVSSRWRRATKPLLSGSQCQSRFAGTAQVAVVAMSDPRVDSTPGRTMNELRAAAASPAVGAMPLLEYQAPLEVVIYPDPRLRARNAAVSVFDARLEEFAHAMFEAMYKYDGVGLSAPQVGVNLQFMVFNPVGERGKGQEYVLVNPKIVKKSKKKDVFEESCLSFPQIYADVERPVGVKIDALDVKGNPFHLELKGWPSRIFQHEYDHLDGVLFFDRMSPSVLTSVRPMLEQLELEYAKQQQNERQSS